MDRGLSVSFLLMIPLLMTAAGGESGSVTEPPPASRPARAVPLPPVMRKLETADNRVVQLPATSPPLSARTDPPPAAPAKDAHVSLAKPAPTKPKKAAPPEEFLLNSGSYCQKQIGHWTLTEARALLGEPVRDRAAAEGSPAGAGRIYAFRDPTARNRELELDFTGKNGRLRTVYVYPWRMNWADCTRLWGNHTSSIQANKGRTFYSFLDRRLDVLVGPDGQVISVGLY